MEMYIDLSNVSEYKFARLQGLCFSRGIFWISGDKSVIGKSLFKQVLITDCLSFCGDEKITHTVSQAMEEIEKLPIDTDRVLTPFSKNKENFIGWRGIYSDSEKIEKTNVGELKSIYSETLLFGVAREDSNVILQDLTDIVFMQVTREDSNVIPRHYFLPIYPPEEKEEMLHDCKYLNFGKNIKNECDLYHYHCSYNDKTDCKHNQLMTNRQLAEWLAKGNGEINNCGKSGSGFAYNLEEANNPPLTDLGYRVRPWDSDVWVKPTVDIYNRDCTK